MDECKKHIKEISKLLNRHQSRIENFVKNYAKEFGVSLPEAASIYLYVTKQYVSEENRERRLMRMSGR